MAAATVVLGLGAVPATAWLDVWGLDLGSDGGVRCHESGATALPGMYAGGECFAWWSRALGGINASSTGPQPRNAEPWSLLACSARNGLPAQRAPYVWSDLYGLSLQFAGEPAFADSEPEIESGSLADGSFAAVYRRSGEPVAVVGLDPVRHVIRLRKRLVVPTPGPTGRRR